MSWNKDNLKKAFEKAGLILEFAKQSFASGSNAADIFGLDIRRKNPSKPNTEYFLMWPGHEDSTISIRDTDKNFGQVVLTISEESREFEEVVDKFRVKRTLEFHKGDAKAVIKDMILNVQRSGYPKVKEWVPKKHHLVVIRQTPKDSRTFLVGMDERQLFMTQVGRNITTVKAAHDSLKTPTVTFYEGKAEGKTIRQGEWFFVNLPKDELTRLETALSKKRIVPSKKVPIGRFAGRSGGKPHTADELVVWDGLLQSEERISFDERVSLIRAARAGSNMAQSRMMQTSPVMSHRREIYVRGAVRHLDHDTVKFSNWRKVIANTEAVSSRNSGTAVGGGTWVD